MGPMQSTSQTSQPRLQVGDLARQTGKTVRAIHLYEELGLLQPISRSPGGFRLYDRAALERVRWIELLSGLGFSLGEMRSVIDRWWDAQHAPEAMADLRAVFVGKLADTRTAIRRHQQLERELLAGLEYLNVCHECEQLESARVCAVCEMNHGVDTAPPLLAGLQHGPARAGRPRAELVRIAESPGRR